MANLDGDTAASKLDLKRATHELEKSIAVEELEAYEQALNKARGLAGDDEIALDAIRQLAIFKPLGVHPSYIYLGWSWRRFGAAHLPPTLT